MLLHAQTGPAPAPTLSIPNAAARDWPAILLFLIAAALFLFGDGGDPIALWDESRNIVNALEMHRQGLSLVTTYGFQPDLWNTKPPLLIWLMSLSVALFGASEWALRLPAGLAAMATLLLVLLFTRRVTRSLGLGLAAASILLLSPGFYSQHGARTADYDTLLTFFTTAYLALLFLAVTRPRPQARLLFLAGLAIAGAVLTKAVAGLLPGLGVALFVLLSRRLPRLWPGPHYLLMGLGAAAPVLLFYAAREAAAPGYLDAVLFNDLFGRFSQVLVDRPEPIWFYLDDASKGWFFAGPLLLAAPLGWRHVPARSRALALYGLCVAGALLLVLSLSSTKLTHYLLPAYPPLAIAAAVLLAGVQRRFHAGASTPAARRGVAAAAALTLALMVGRSLHWRYVELPALHHTEPGRYGPLFAALAAQGITHATVDDPGVPLHQWPTYAPILRSYQLMWAERGLLVERDATGAVLASCHPDTAARLVGEAGADIAAVEGCAAVRTRR